MRKILTITFVLTFTLSLLVGCGFLGLTRPSYPNQLDMTIDEILEKHPELKGIVITAPQYMKEYRAKLAKWKEKEERPEEEKYYPQPGTRIQIVVLNRNGEKEYESKMKIAPNYRISFPLIGEIFLKGKTLKQIEDLIKKKYAEKIINPDVTINVISEPAGTLYGVERYIKAGEAGIFGTTFKIYKLEGGETISKIIGKISLGDGDEWRRIRVLKKGKDGKLGRIVFVDFMDFLWGHNLNQDIPIHPGDIIIIPGHWGLGHQWSQDWNFLMDYIGDTLSFWSMRDQIKVRIHVGDEGLTSGGRDKID